MDSKRQYEIAFVGLKLGVHNFKYTIDDEFFALFGSSLVTQGNLTVKLKFDKHLSFFILDFQIGGTVELPCGRCSAMIDFPIKAQFPIVVKFDEHGEGQKDDSMADVIYISRSDNHLDVGQLIYEFIHLSVPMHRVNCDSLKGEKPCNKEVLKQLNKKAPKEKTRNIDPRWGDLSKIKFN